MRRSTVRLAVVIQRASLDSTTFRLRSVRHDMPEELQAAAAEYIRARREQGISTARMREDAALLSTHCKMRTAPGITLPGGLRPTALSPAPDVVTSPTVNYGPREALAYLLGRLPATYAIANRVFSELRFLDPEFKPDSIMDVGAGVGSATWAASAVWPELSSVTCVDPADAMLSTCKELLAALPEQINVRYSHYVPINVESGTHDVTVANFTLADLPSAESRLKLLQNMWKRTRHYMVLTEHGSLSGFALINEARKIFTGSQPVASRHGPATLITDAIIVAPCPRQGQCPRDGDLTPCTFPQHIVYPEAHRFSRSLQKANNPSEKFSYLILARRDAAAAAQRESLTWPRLVELPRKGKGTVYLGVCVSDADTVMGRGQQEVETPDAEQQAPAEDLGQAPAASRPLIVDAVISKRDGKAVWKDARQRRWGEQLPPAAVAEAEAERQTEAVEMELAQEWAEAEYMAKLAKRSQGVEDDGAQEDGGAGGGETPPTFDEATLRQARASREAFHREMQEQARRTQLASNKALRTAVGANDNSLLQPRGTLRRGRQWLR